MLRAFGVLNPLTESQVKIVRSLFISNGQSVSWDHLRPCKGKPVALLAYVDLLASHRDVSPAVEVLTKVSDLLRYFSLVCVILV